MVIVCEKNIIQYMNKIHLTVHEEDSKAICIAYSVLQYIAFRLYVFHIVFYGIWL